METRTSALAFGNAIGCPIAVVVDEKTGVTFTCATSSAATPRTPASTNAPRTPGTIQAFMTASRRFRCNERSMCGSSRTRRLAESWTTNSAPVVRSRLPEAHHALGGGRRQPVEIGVGGVEALARHPLPSRPRRDDRPHCRPTPARRLAQDEHGIGAIAAHQPVHHLDRNLAQASQRGHHLLVLLLPGELDQRCLVELALARQPLDEAQRRRIIAWAPARADLVRHLRQ